MINGRCLNTRKKKVNEKGKSKREEERTKQREYFPSIGTLSHERALAKSGEERGRRGRGETEGQEFIFDKVDA